MNQYNIGIIEDDLEVQHQIEKLLNSVGLKTESYISAEKFLQPGNKNKFHCLVVDMRLPGISGLALQQKLTEKKISTPCVFLSGHSNIRISVKALKMGASDFLTKPFDHQELLDSIFETIEKHQQNQNKAKKYNDYKKKLQLLTSQEKKILSLIAQGEKSKSIAHYLNISKNTADVHRNNIMQKMQTKSIGKIIADYVKFQENNQ